MAKPKDQAAESARRGRPAPFGGDTVERVTAFVPVELAAAIRLEATRSRRTISEVIAALSVSLLPNAGGPKSKKAGG